MKFDKFYHGKLGIFLTGTLAATIAGLLTYFVLPLVLNVSEIEFVILACVVVLVLGYFVYLIYAIGDTDNGFVCFLTIAFTVLIDLIGAFIAFYYSRNFDSGLANDVSPWIWIIPHAIVVSTAFTPLFMNMLGSTEIDNPFKGILLRYNPIICFVIFYFGLYGLSYSYSAVSFFSVWLPLILPLVFLVLNIVSWKKQDINIENDLDYCESVFEIINKHKQSANELEQTPEPECFKGLTEAEKVRKVDELEYAFFNYEVKAPLGGMTADEFLDAFCTYLVLNHGFKNATHEKVEYTYPLSKDGCAKGQIHLTIDEDFAYSFSGVTRHYRTNRISELAQKRWDAMRASTRASWDNDFYNYLFHGTDGKYDHAKHEDHNEYLEAVDLTIKKVKRLFSQYYDRMDKKYGIYGKKEVTLGAYRKPNEKQKYYVKQYVPTRLETFDYNISCKKVE